MDVTLVTFFNTKMHNVHIFSLRYLQIACISVVHEGCTIISGWVRIQRRRG